MSMVNLVEKQQKKEGVADYNWVITELHCYIFSPIIGNDILSFVNFLQISFFFPTSQKCLL